MHDKLDITATRLKSEILAELQLLADFSHQIEKIKTYIQEKDWIGLEERLKELDAVATQVDSLERIRHSSFCSLKQQLGLPADASFSRVLPALDYNLRSELTELHQQLKLKVLKVRIEYQNLGYYLRNISGFIYRFLEEVFPHTRGKIYSRQGKAAVAAPESIMINREL